MKDFKGVDISKWNGENNFSLAKKEIDFAIIRSTYGYNKNFVNGGIDEKFEENYKSLKDENILIGVYHYSYARTLKESELEAYKILKVLNKREIDLAVFYDVEDEILFTYDKNITDRILTFTKIIQKEGYKAGVYANKYWMENYIDKEKLKNENLKMWIAFYNENLFNKDPNYFKGSYNIWQYTDKGKVNGISNYKNGIQTVDMNIMYEEDFKTKENFLKKDLDDFYLIPECANFKLNVDKIFVREKPNRQSKKVSYYTKGQTIAYDYYTINDGHIWISYIARSGKRRYVATGEHNGQKRTSLWGKFF